MTVKQILEALPETIEVQIGNTKAKAKRRVFSSGGVGYTLAGREGRVTHGGVDFTASVNVFIPGLAKLVAAGTVTDPDGLVQVARAKSAASPATLIALSRIVQGGEETAAEE